MTVTTRPPMTVTTARPIHRESNDDAKRNFDDLTKLNYFIHASKFSVCLDL